VVVVVVVVVVVEEEEEKVVDEKLVLMARGSAGRFAFPSLQDLGTAKEKEEGGGGKRGLYG